jgi:hypothetical protein
VGQDPDQNPDKHDFDLAAFRARQKARNRALGLLLGALVVLFFAITVVKLGVQADKRHGSSLLYDSAQHG